MKNTVLSSLAFSPLAVVTALSPYVPSTLAQNTSAPPLINQINNVFMGQVSSSTTRLGSPTTS